MKLIGDRIAIKPYKQEDEISAGGIYIPSSISSKPQEGEVIAVGIGKMYDNGERVATEVKIGYKVLYVKYGGVEATIDGDKLLVLHEDEILGIINGELSLTGNRILLKLTNQDNQKSQGGLFIPPTARKQFRVGKIIKVGSGVRAKNGIKLPFISTVGDSALIPHGIGVDYEIDNEEHVFVREDDIIVLLK